MEPEQQVNDCVPAVAERTVCVLSSLSHDARGITCRAVHAAESASRPPGTIVHSPLSQTPSSLVRSWSSHTDWTVGCGNWSTARRLSRSTCSKLAVDRSTPSVTSPDDQDRFRRSGVAGQLADHGVGGIHFQRRLAFAPELLGSLGFLLRA